MLREAVTTILKGMWVGGTMTVPGVSGGTMAIVMGVYDRLITSVSGFLKHPRKSIEFLLCFSAGGLAGVAIFAKVITALLENAEWGGPVRYFFVGAVAAGIPLIFKEGKIHKFDYRVVVYPTIGALLVIGIAMLPDGLFAIEEGNGASGVLIQLICGVIIAIALVFPGISASQMLYMFGIYDEVIKDIGEFNILPLIPLAIGLMLGIILTTRAIELLIEKFPGETYMVILGFVAASVVQLFPGLKELFQIKSILLLIAGMGIIYGISNRQYKAG